MKKCLRFFSLWLINSLLVFLANLFFPNSYVLGSHIISPVASVFFAGFIWTLLTWIAQPVLRKCKIKITKRAKVWLVYFGANFVALWLTGHLAPYSGLGILNFCWVIGLALVANSAQYLIWHFWCKKVLK
jgi:uncharacterized membrane protein YvlD (DUF360 family)